MRQINFEVKDKVTYGEKSAIIVKKEATAYEIEYEDQDGLVREWVDSEQLHMYNILAYDEDMTGATKGDR